MELSKRFVISIKLFIFIGYGVMICSFIVVYGFVFQNDYGLEDVDGICLIENEPSWSEWTRIALLATLDSNLGIFTVGLYFYKFYQLHRGMRDLQAMNIVSGKQCANDNKLSYTTKKQFKLTWISYLSTIIIVYWGANDRDLRAIFIAFFLYIDSLINVLCVYCTFEIYDNVYQMLCNCNANKWCLWIFCWCCYCCNADRIDTLKKLRSVETTTKTDSSMVSKSGATIITSSTSDTSSPGSGTEMV